MKKIQLVIILVLAFFSLKIEAQTPIDSTFSGIALITQLRTNYTPSQTLGYNNARDVMYSIIDNDGNNGVHGIYTDFTVFWTPGTDPSTDVYQGGSGINAEHIYPQSMGASSEPAKSDLHNLRPSRALVNSTRGNLKFGESIDSNTDKWFKDATVQTTMPSTDIDDWSEVDNSNLFEPRELVKGDIARIVFYFYTIYPNADATFFNSMLPTLYDWHYADPVDAWELERNNRVKQEQGNDNPYILDSTLARRAFYPQYTVTATSQIDHQSKAVSINIYPNPFSNQLDFSVPVNAVTILNTSGKIILQRQTEQSFDTIDVSNLPKGIYYIRYQTESLMEGSQVILK